MRTIRTLVDSGSRMLSKCVFLYCVKIYKTLASEVSFDQKVSTLQHHTTSCFL